MALKISCQHKARELRYKLPRISHIVARLLLSLYLYTEDTEMVGETGNIFLFPAISLSARSEATLVARRWYTDLDRSTFVLLWKTLP